jgi:hypothetical protein
MLKIAERLVHTLPGAVLNVFEGSESVAGRGRFRFVLHLEFN